MELVRYMRAPVVDIKDDCCIHLEEDTLIHISSEQASVWLESYEPSRTLAHMSRLRKPVLNSLWLDERYFAAYSGSLAAFQEIVLVPYDPQGKDKPYETSLQRILDMAKSYNIPNHRIIVDLAILPYVKHTNLTTYRQRLTSLKKAGYKTVAAFDNVIHCSPDKLKLLHQLWEELQDKLTYAIIRDRYYDELNRYSKGGGVSA